MEKLGLIAMIDYHYSEARGHRNPAKRIPPRRIGRVWQIGNRGFADIQADPSSPKKPAIVRPSLLAHDVMTGEVITRVVEWTRPFLSAIYVEHEERLDDARRKPIADAMLVVRYDREVSGKTVPWKSAPPGPTEDIRFYAVEMDRNTEEYKITDEKAVNYRTVRNDPTFYERFGPMFPAPLIIVPSETRLQRWHAGWKERWPYGVWLITTDERLARDEWLEFSSGSERWRTFTDGWKPPASSQAASAAPGTTRSDGVGTTATAATPSKPRSWLEDPRIPR
jgi:hypothetical protein